MKATILGMLAETSIHPGSGQDAGFVDLPVARESATDFPVIAGSSLKGALLDRARQVSMEDSERDLVFGQQDNAGKILVGDARLLMLPIRSLKGAYKWITCPQLITRLQRDSARMHDTAPASGAVNIPPGQYLGNNHASLFLEERQFEFGGEMPEGVVEQIGQLMLSGAGQLNDRMVILSDDDFAWFARYGLAINARNFLDKETKSSKNLWYEETIPPDALFYSLVAQRDSKSDGALDKVLELFSQRPYLQVGGNETVGQGWFAIRPLAMAGGTV